MPVQVSYPGVYIEEIPSGTHSISGISTSMAAFIGRAKCGPVNEPTIITSFGEFQRLFGGLWKESNLGYSVMAFFNNGGSQAVIVRLYKESSADNAPPAAKEINVGDLYLVAANPGEWGERLMVEIDFNVQQQVADKYELKIDKMFNLTVMKYDEKYKTLQQERHENITIEDLNTEKHHNLQKIDFVLKHQSNLLRYKKDAELPKDLDSIKALVKNGGVKYSVENEISELKEKIGELGEDKTEEKEKLQKKINSLKSSDGEQLDAECFVGTDNQEKSLGIYALDDIRPYVFNLLVIPPYNPDDVDTVVVEKAAEYCEKKKAFMIVDPPSLWETTKDAINGLNNIGTSSKNAAIYFPRIVVPDPLNNYKPKLQGPSGAIAGIYATTDVSQGVWKAPAGTNAVLNGVGISKKLSDLDSEQLNPLGINCLRQFPVYGNVVWGARTLQGADILSSEWKYINVRRLALYIEQSIQQDTKWTVFEPNDQTLWVSLRQSITSFLSSLYANGAFAGSKQEDAFFVKVDSTTTTQIDIDRGVVNIEVGFAPLKPAEFIILHFQQLAGQDS